MEWILDTFKGIANFFKGVFMIVKMIIQGIVELPKIIAYAFGEMTNVMGVMPTAIITLFALALLVGIIARLVKWH